MKTSNILLLTALLVLVGSLTAYNMALRAEYRRGTYKDPLREYSKLPYSNFDAVMVPAGNAVSVKIVAGPYAVRVSPEAAGYVQVRQQGRQLTVTASFPGHYRDLMQEAVVISCPRLTRLSTDARYAEDGKTVQELRSNNWHRVRVEKFRQDTLLVQADRASRVELSGNRLAYLAAETGRTPGSKSVLSVDDDNHIGAASLQLAGQSELNLGRVPIPALRYQVGDSVEVNLKGAALRALAH